VLLAEHAEKVTQIAPNQAEAIQIGCDIPINKPSALFLLYYLFIFQQYFIRDCQIKLSVYKGLENNVIWRSGCKAHHKNIAI
jgi:hypothetical protein